MPRVEGNAAVTDRHAADERLREAFQALGDASQQALSPDEVDRVWQAVSGTLPQHWKASPLSRAIEQRAPIGGARARHRCRSRG